MSGQITRRDIIEDEALRWGPEYAKQLDIAISKNKEFVDSLVLLNAENVKLRRSENQTEFLKQKSEVKIAIEKNIGALKEQLVAETNVEKVRQESLRTEKLSLDVASKKASAQKRNTSLTAEERVQNELNNRALKQQARENLGLVGAYEKLNRSRTEAKNKLADLLAAETKNNAEIRKAQKEYETLNTKVLKVDKATDNYTKNIGNYKSAVSGFGGILSNLLGAFGVVGGITLFAGAVKNIFEVTKELQSLDNALKQVTGTQANFAEQQSFLKRISRDYGVEIKGLTQQYTQFYVAAKDKLAGTEIQNIFESITKSGASMGLSVESQQRAFLALNQMMSKGTIQAEELRGQLGEALPGAFQTMVKAYQSLHPEAKITESDFAKLMKDGKIIASEILPEFAKQLEKTFGIENVKNVDSLSAAQTRLSNAWTDFVRSLDEDGNTMSKVLKGILGLMTETIEGWRKIFTSSGTERKNYLQKIRDESKADALKYYDDEKKFSDDDLKNKIANFAAEAKQRERLVDNFIKVNKLLKADRKGFDSGLYSKEGEKDYLQWQKNNKEINKGNEAIEQYNGWISALQELTFKGKKSKITESEDEIKKRLEAEKKLAKEKADLEKQLADSLYELQKQRLEQTIKLNEEIVNEETQSDDVRLQALTNSQIKQLELIELTKNHLLDNDKLTANDRIRIEEDFSNKVLEINSKTQAQIDKINQFDLKKYQSDLERKVKVAETEMNNLTAEEEKRFNEELKSLDKNQKDIEKATERHEEILFNIKRDAAIAIAKIQYDNLQNELQAFKLQSDGSEKSAKIIEDIENRLSLAKKAIWEAENKTFKNKEEEKKSISDNAAREQAKAILEISQQLTSALSDLASAIFETKIQNIDYEIDKNNEYYDRQIELAGNDNRQKDLLEKEREKKNKELEDRKRKEQIKQAIFNKGIQASQVIMATSLAVISTLAQVPKFDFGISASTLAAFVAGIGAIQLAAVLATPLPKYKDGRKGGPAEFAITGDGGRSEIISRPDGSDAIRTPNTPTLTYLKAGDIVHKSEEDYQKYLRASMMADMNKNVSDAKNYQILVNSNNDFSKLEDKIEKGIKEGFKRAKIQINNEVKTDDLNHEIFRFKNLNWNSKK